MRKLIQQVALCLGATVSVPALAVDIELLNETNYAIQVQGGAAVPSGTSTWVKPTARLTLAKPGGDTLEYRFEETRTGHTIDACDYNVLSWGFLVKLFEKTSSTGVERLLGEICAAREVAFRDTVARLRFQLYDSGDYGLVFENRGTKNELVVGSISAALPALGKSTGITSGLLGNGDHVFGYKDQCLINGVNGHSAVPERFSWGGAGLCGLGAAAVQDNKQAVITLRKIDAERYVLLSAIWRFQTRGSVGGGLYSSYEFTGQSCLQANADGTVERTIAGTSDMCNALSDADFKNRPELLWKIKEVDGGTFITNSAHGGIEKCLIFGNRGAAITPTLFNWGVGGEVCGLPRGDFISNGQAAWKPVRLH
jgi:hypothetical protein